MRSKIIFRMVAYTDAAGKFSVDAPRNGNEDNFFFAYDLSKDAPSKGEPDVDTQMSECGLLMVVADGMGGMNAGEVASQIAVDTVAEFFAPGKITPEFAKDHQKRKKYMEHVISEADIRIKKDSKHDSEHKGMGSTIIMAWIVGDELTLSWCGDSRAYRYNPACGIEPLSRDHSYVQELADKGIIKYEDTFDHPQGNIVTRSLGDVSKKAIPETELFKVYNDDIILLCSDGLSGVLRDKKTYDMDGELIEGDNLEDIICANRSSLKECREALWRAAEKAEWYDNVTAILCEIRSGAETYIPEKRIEKDTDTSKTLSSSLNKTFQGINIRLSTKGIFLSIIGFIIFTGVIFFTAWKFFSIKQGNGQAEIVMDSLRNKPIEQDDSCNINLDIVKKKTELQIKLNELSDSLNLPSGNRYIQEINMNLNKANNFDELKKINDAILLWKQKLPYIKKVKSAMTNNSSNRDILDNLKNLLDDICKSMQIDETWEKTLEQITKKPKHQEIKKEEGIDKLPPDTELTPVENQFNEDHTEIISTIQNTDTYSSFCQSIEKKVSGYRVDKIETKVGRVIVDEVFFDKFRSFFKRDVIVYLIKKEN